MASALVFFPALIGASTHRTWAAPSRNDPSPLPVGQVQGTGEDSPYTGRTVTVEGVVTGDFQGPDQFRGVFIQDAGDGDEATSDGIFVYDKSANDLNVGDRVRVRGKVSEHKNQTQITPSSVTKLESGITIAPTELSLPVTNWERYEGMLLRFPQALTILDAHNFDRYGELTYGLDRQWVPTSIVDPGQPANDLLASNNTDRLLVDDGRSSQNPSPAIHPDGKPMAQDNYFRSGDQVTNLTGILSYDFESYRLQPTTGADHSATNPRPGTAGKPAHSVIQRAELLHHFDLRELPCPWS